MPCSYQHNVLTGVVETVGWQTCSQCCTLVVPVAVRRARRITERCETGIYKAPEILSDHTLTALPLDYVCVVVQPIVRVLYAYVRIDGLETFWGGRRYWRRHLIRQVSQPTSVPSLKLQNRVRGDESFANRLANPFAVFPFKHSVLRSLILPS